MALTKEQLLALISSKIYTNVANEVSGDDVADVANEIVEAVFHTVLWELVGTTVTPTSDRDVSANNLEVVSNLKLSAMSFVGATGSRMRLEIDTDGNVVSSETKMGIISSGTTSNQDIIFDVIFISSENNYNYKLAAAQDNIGKEITVRKAAGTAYELELEAGTGDALLVNDTFSVGIKTSTQGAWVTLKAFYDGTVSGWAVITDSGDWTGYV